MLGNIATVLAGLIGVGVVLMGARAFRAPQAAVGFGIPDTPAQDRTFQAWLSVKAVRDIAAGLLILVVLAGGTTHLLGWSMLVATAIPVGDALVVRRSGGPGAAVYGIHGATAAVMLAVSVLLLVA
ncbi:DUF4267 domain-containing protein [Plantactinospora sp. WMMB782]|uniref:DUF4267 domain-containing protein n=1 Tax=Plantactinospora sp. WMMB782 TaxID=3404121 RepID=UPI003B92950C